MKNIHKVKEETFDFLRKENIEGWLTKKEGELLFDLAREVSSDGKIVEIGSWMGKSTIWLGKGSLRGHKAMVCSVDTHTGNKELYDLYKGRENDFDFFKDGKIWTYDIFLSNIKKAKIKSVVRPLVMTSEEATNVMKESLSLVSLLFIDGDHEYEAVLKDYNLWSPLIQERGIITFHDVSRRSVREVINEKIRDNEKWEILMRIDNLFVARKLA